MKVRGWLGSTKINLVEATMQLVNIDGEAHRLLFTSAYDSHKNGQNIEGTNSWPSWSTVRTRTTCHKVYIVAYGLAAHPVHHHGSPALAGTISSEDARPHGIIEPANTPQ